MEISATVIFRVQQEGNEPWKKTDLEDGMVFVCVSVCVYVGVCERQINGLPVCVGSVYDTSDLYMIDTLLKLYNCGDVIACRESL